MTHFRQMFGTVRRIVVQDLKGEKGLHGILFSNIISIIDILVLDAYPL